MLAEVRRRGFDAEKVTSVLTWALVASLLGARFLTFPPTSAIPATGGETSSTSPATTASSAGTPAGIIAGVIRMRMLGCRSCPLLDMAAPGLALGAVVGRIGDLAIVEHLGSPTSFFLGYTVRGGYDIAPQHDALECVADICGTYHHTALYDMIGAAVLLVVLLLLRTRWDSRRYGQLFAVWAMWYGVQRFLIDFTRLGAAGTEPCRLGDGAVHREPVGRPGGGRHRAVCSSRWRHNPVVSSAQDAAYGADNGLLVEALVPAGASDPEEATAPPPAMSDCTRRGGR